MTRIFATAALVAALTAGSASAGGIKSLAASKALTINGTSYSVGTVLAKGAAVVVAGYLAWNTLVPAGKLACRIATSRACGA